MAETERVRVALIDDHDLLRRGIKTMLETAADFDIVGEAADGVEALKLVEEAVPDVVLIDVIMPNMDGIQATKQIKDSFPKIGAVVLSGHDERQFLFDALKAGASGYLLKTAHLEEVVATVRSAARGEAKLDPALASQVLSEFQAYQKADLAEVYQPLTPREREILRLMSDGLPNKTIASRLKISERTVNTTSPTSTRSFTSTTAFPRSRRRCAGACWTSTARDPMAAGGSDSRLRSLPKVDRIAAELADMF